MSMSDFNAHLRLEEDYGFLKELVLKRIGVFDEESEEANLAYAWKTRLAIEDPTINGKQLRNLYMCKLLNCCQIGLLIEPFTSYPPSFSQPLPQLPRLVEVSDENVTEPPWVSEIIGKQYHNYLPTKDCKTYISTKVLDDKRGICGYIAVSVKDMGQEKPEFHAMGSNADVELLSELF